MKRLLLLALSFALTSAVFAQNSTQEKKQTMSLGSHNAFVLDLDGINEDKALDYWRDYFRDEVCKLKRNRKAKQYYASGASIKLISDKKIDVYSKIEELGENSRLYVWLDNQGAFISSETNPEEAKGAKDFINNFAVFAEKEHVEELLEESKDQLSGYEKDLKRLGKDKASYEKAIEKAKKAIIENEKNIEQNTSDQLEKAKQIDVQKKKVEEIMERLKNVGMKKESRGM